MKIQQIEGGTVQGSTDLLHTMSGLKVGVITCSDRSHGRWLSEGKIKKKIKNHIMKVRSNLQKHNVRSEVRHCTTNCKCYNDSKNTSTGAATVTYIIYQSYGFTQT